MHGKILIIDATATNRIVLKVKLAANAHRPLLARSATEGLGLLAGATVDLVILGADVADLAVPDLIRAIRAVRGGADLPLLMLAAPGDEAAITAAFEAGLDDCLLRPLPDALLHARVRALLRGRAEEAGLALPFEGALSGWSEPAAGFAPPARIALVADRPEAALRWRAALGPHLHDRIEVHTPDDALAGAAHPGVDLYVLLSDPQVRGEGLQVMTELHSRALTGGGLVCMVLPEGAAALAAAALDLGASGVVTAGLGGAAAAARLRAILRRKRRRDARRTALRSSLQMALTDPLTGLHNRRHAIPALDRLRTDAALRALPLAVMIIDVDRFKSVNDSFGHAAGDAVLVEIARRLGHQAGQSGLLARIGGEEFLFSCMVADLDHALACADGLRCAVQGGPIAVPNGQGDLRMTVSIGLALVPPDPLLRDPVDQILHRADTALLRAKGGGRNQVTLSRSAA